MALSRSVVAGITLSALLSACVSTEERVSKVMDESLEGGFSTYRNMSSYPGEVTCGQYLTKDYRGDPIYQDFIVIETEAINRPTRLDLAVYCSDDPEKSLNETLGIDYNAQKATVDAILADFAMLEGPLLAYEKDNGYFPWTEQTLDALVSPAKVGNPPRNWPAGGYLDSIPVDPWGNTYDYVCDAFAGVRVMYKLQSLGADGQKGGIGENADIKASYLKYFRHIESLAK